MFTTNVHTTALWQIPTFSYLFCMCTKLLTRDKTGMIFQKFDVDKNVNTG